jgi:CRISPR/Cas system-associated protein Csm6
LGRLLIFTAGTSLLDNLKDPDKFARRALADAFAYTGAGAWHKVLRRAEGIRDKLTSYASPFAPLSLAHQGERSRATAEMAGFYLLRKDQPTSQDRLVLLCSDTGEGAFCALANGMLLGQEVCYYAPRGYYVSSGDFLTLPGLAESEVEHGFHSSLLTIRLPQVTVVVVRDLDASRPNEFERHAIPALVRATAELHYNKRAEQQTVLNYTGGFKAAIPTLAQVAAVAGGIELVCLYEDALDLVHQPLIQIKLRPEAEERLIWAGENDEEHPDPLDPQRDFTTLDSLPEDEWPFYKELARGGLDLSSLGRAMRELLRAKARWSEIQG